jgi:hypothetical protein
VTAQALPEALALPVDIFAHWPDAIFDIIVRPFRWLT